MKKEEKVDGGVYKRKRVKVGESCVCWAIVLPPPFSCSLFKINKFRQKFVNPSLNFVCVFNALFLLGYLLSDLICCVDISNLELKYENITNR